MTNPLAKYFRVPGVSVKIPSNGKYQPEGNIKFSMTGELDVYPMKASDELLLKSPDALISGQALENMISSCVPNVSDVRALPNNDVDTLFVAIRAATYGNELEINDVCPKCESEQTFIIDIGYMITSMTFLEEAYDLQLNDFMTVTLRPLTFAENSKVSRIMFEETKKMQVEINREDITPEQKDSLNAAAYAKMHALNIEVLAMSIDKVTTPEHVVTDFDDIHEFVANAPMGWFKQLEDKVKEITSVGISKSAVVQCGSCEHEWETEIVFDPASFFKISS